MLANGITHGLAAPEAEEHGLELLWLSEDEITKKIISGDMLQKNALSAWALYKAHTKAV